MKKNFKTSRFTTRGLCTLGMLLALTVIMSVFFTLRIGEAIKLPTKFLPISVAAMLYGPVFGGVVGALADILAYIVNPVAAFMPQITLVEFLYGFSYGIFLKNCSKSPKGYALAFLCVLFQIVFLHILLTSYLLLPVTGVSFAKTLIMRLPAAGINCIIQLVGLFFTVSLSGTLKKAAGKL